MDDFVGDNAGGEALQRADGRAVADEVPRVAMIGQRVVLGGEPVVEAVVIGLRLPRKIEPAIKMPLAGVRGVVAAISKDGGNGDFFLEHMHR